MLDELAADEEAQLGRAEALQMRRHPAAADETQVASQRCACSM